MTDQLDRLKAALADRYMIERELGRGGMATVYLAKDLKHHRQVAIKVLDPELAHAIGHGRFLQEIEIAAQLNHPHILPLHDSGDANGLLYYVMPYVEGESLRDRLDREGQLPMEDVSQIVEEVADALSYAHSLGVIHRDIKPENILFTAGHAVVSDFGIAKAVDAAGGQSLTETGLAIGTPTYMSPEQAGGEKKADGRSDIYSLGCVAYEMLGGQPPFTGPTPQAILARHSLDPVPPLRTVRPAISASVEGALDKALAKTPADRFRSAKDFAEAFVSEAPGTPVEQAARTTKTSRWPRHLRTTVSVGAVAVVLGWALFGRDQGSPGSRTVGTIRPLTSFIGWEAFPSWSPDGTMIAYSHIAGGDADVVTLSVGGGDPHILTGDSPADEILPRWSPDASKIAFVSDRGAGTDVYWIPPTGGAERKVTETNIPFLERMGAWGSVFGSNPWSPDGTELVFSRLHDNGDVALWKVNLETREETQLTQPPPGGEDGVAAWSFNGETIAFVRSEKGVRTTWLLPAAGGELSPLLADGEPGDAHYPVWFPDDRRLLVLSARGGGRDLWELELHSGVLRQLTFGGGRAQGPAVARNGVIAYTQFAHQIDLYWAPRNPSSEEHERLTSFTGDNFGARVSPDGNSIVYYSSRSGDHDLWLHDRTTGRERQLTDHPASDRLLDWSPDGREIVFMSSRSGAVTLWIVELETGATRQLTDHELTWSGHTAKGQGGPRWAPDGSVIGYLAPETGNNAIWVVNPDGSNPRASGVRGALSFGWYRDSKRVVYTRRDPSGSGLIELRAAHLGTGEDVLLRAGAMAEVDPSPDGSGVIFVDAVSHFGMELYLLPLAPPRAPSQLPTASGEPIRLTFGEGLWHVHSGGWAPDGSGLVYSRDRDEGDIYVILPPGQE